MLKEQPLISVIVPIYNVSCFLSEALSSITKQTYKKLEIILIDDGSTDESGAICESYLRKDKRMVLIHQENKGLSVARNRGLDLAHGDMIVFLDPDDFYHVNYIESMYEAMCAFNADVVICRYKILADDGKERKNLKQVGPALIQGRYNRQEALQALYNGELNNYVWNKLYRRELWENIRYPEGHIYEDIATSYRVFDLCESVYMLDQTLYYYRLRTGSITNSNTRKNALDWIRAWHGFDAYVRRNIPRVFSKEQLVNQRQLEIRQMIVFYWENVNKEVDSETDRDAFLSKVRKSINFAVKEVGLKGCGAKIRVFCWMINRCPGLLARIIPLYILLYKGIHRI